MLLSVFLAWVFTEVIPPLIASCFYVTEGEGTGGRVLFYRKQDWEELRAAGEAQMGTHFVKVRLDGASIVVVGLLDGVYVMRKVIFYPFFFILCVVGSNR